MVVRGCISLRLASGARAAPRYPMSAPVGIALMSVVVAVNIIELVYPMSVVKLHETIRCFVPSATTQGVPPSVALMTVPSRTGNALPIVRGSPAETSTASFDRYEDARANAEMGRRTPAVITQKDFPSALFTRVPSGCWVRLVMSVPGVPSDARYVGLTGIAAADE